MSQSGGGWGARGEGEGGECGGGAQHGGQVLSDTIMWRL